MDFFHVIQKRRSVRAFEPKLVDEDQLTAVLESANAAPSAGNLQAYEIVVVTDPARKRSLARAALRQEFLETAPVVLAFFQNRARSAATYGERGARLYALQDATIACAYAQLAATALGLSSCWVGAFRDDAVAEALGAPRELDPVALLPLGYAAESPRASGRRELTDLVRRQRF